jgi:hypothetical protein
MKVLRGDPARRLAGECCFGADLFDTELILRAERQGLVTAELPVTVSERRPSRTPMWRRALRSLWGLVRLRLTLGGPTRGARKPVDALRATGGNDGAS